MIRLKASKARGEFSAVLKGVNKGQRFILSRHDKDVAAIVPVKDLELLQMIEDRLDRRAARLALDDAEKHGTITWEALKEELGL